MTLLWTNSQTQGMAYVPFFPLGGFTPLQSSELDAVAASVSATPMQVALAWLLHRAPNILLIPGTSSVKHLRENLQAAALQLSPETIAKLDSIADSKKTLRKRSMIEIFLPFFDVGRTSLVCWARSNDELTLSWSALESVIK